MAGPAQYETSLWDVAFSQLPEDQQHRLKAGLTLPLKFIDLKTSIGTAQEHAASKWRFKTRHGEIDIREKFSKIVLWVQKFIEIGDVAVNYDPGHAALPWAALRLVFQVMVNNTTRAVKFVEGLEQVAFYIYDSAVRENLYLTTEPSEDGNDLTNHILALYAIILRFLLQARLFFEASSTRRLLSSSIKSADEVVQMLGSAVQQANQILTISGRLDTRIQISTSVSISDFSDHHAESMAWLKEQAKGNDLIISNVMNSIAFKHQENMAHFDSAEKRYEENFRLEIFNWLSTIPYQRHHKSAFGEVLKGTGSWFLEDSAYQNWKNGDESAVLWVHGIPGSGKTKLTSLAIQTELEKGQRSSFPLYFYCSCTPAEPERATAEGILRSLVKQISSGGASEAMNAIPSYVLEKYKEAKSRGFASGELMLDECYDVISRFIIDTGEVRILIDGLDECDEDARNTLIDALNTILEGSSPSIVKLLISSRDSPYLVSFFDQHKTYEIHVASHRVQNDIELYVRHELDRLISRKRFLVGGKPPSAKLQHYIITRLCDDVQGMFRWVSLQLDYICTLRTAGDIKSRLGRLPWSLSDSYDELYQKRTKDYEPEERERLEIALTLLLVSVQPTDPAELTHLVYGDQEGERFSENEDGTSTSDDDDTSDCETDGKEKKGVGGEGASWKYESITSLCFNLVVFDSTTGFFRFAHTSVQDYLQNRNPKFKTASQNYARLAEHHLSRLLYKIKFSSQEVYPKYSGEIPGLFESHTIPESEAFENSIDSFRDFWYFDVPASAFTSLRGCTIRVIETRWANYVAESGECRYSSPLKEMQAELLDLLVNQPWQYVRPWLFFSACTYGLRDFVETSIKAHPQLARIAQRCPYQTTALRETCMHDQNFPEIVKTVIENDNGFHSLQGSPLCSAVGNGHFAIAKMLLDKDPGLISRKDVVSPLGWAFSTKQTETINIIRLLIERGADVQEVHREYVGSTTLHLAAENQGPEVLKLLLDNGALVNAPDFYGLSPLVAAISRGTNLDNCKLLLDRGADITIRDPRGGTPLEVAASHNKVNGVQFLLDHHVDVNTTSLGTYGTALHIACHKGHEGIAEKLLASGADPNIINIYGDTALSLAVQDGYWQIVKLLVPHSTKILNAQDAYGDTPLVHAARKCHVETVKLLLEAGAEIVPQAPGPDCPFLSPEDRVAGYAQDALVVAWRRKHTHILRILMQTAAERAPGGDYEEMLRLLNVHEEKPVGEWSPDDDAAAQTEAVRVPNRATETLDDWIDRRSPSSQNAQRLDHAATRDGILEKIGRMMEESERKITEEMKREYTWWKPEVEVRSGSRQAGHELRCAMRTCEYVEE